MKTRLIKVNKQRLLDSIAISSSIGATDGCGLYRLALSKEDKEMRNIFVNWLEEIGLDVRIDDFGNIYGRREGRRKGAPAVAVGSHLDSQPYGGRFDGVLGVLTALEVIRVLNEQNITTEYPIEIINFTNEEGARFEPPMLGSGGLTGVFTKEEVYNITDRNGISFADALKKIEYMGEKKNRINNINSFIELHVEQGPVLHQKNKSIGIVEGVQGMTWMNVEIKGEPDHAGSTPMDNRKDALLSASKMIAKVNEITRDIDGLITTVGRIESHPNVVNVIPNKVQFSIDVRHENDDVRNYAMEQLKEQLSTIALLDQTEIVINTFWNSDAISFAKDIIEVIKGVTETLNYSYHHMYSGAGHDAKYMHTKTKTAMIFLPSVNGKSHNENELTLDEHIEKGGNILLYVIQKLAKVIN